MWKNQIIRGFTCGKNATLQLKNVAPSNLISDSDIISVPDCRRLWIAQNCRTGTVCWFVSAVSFKRTK